MVGCRLCALVFVAFLLSVVCATSHGVDVANAAEDGCSSGNARKATWKCYSSLVEASEQAREDGADARAVFCCCLHGVETCLTSALNHYECYSEEEVEQQTVNLMSEALNSDHLVMEGPCNSYNEVTCGTYLRPFQTAISEWRPKVVHANLGSVRKPRQDSSNSTALPVNESSPLSTEFLNVFENMNIVDFTTNLNDSLSNYSVDAEGPFSIDWELLRRIIIVVTDRNKTPVLVLRVSQVYDGSFTTDAVPIDSESGSKVIEWTKSSKLVVIDSQSDNTTAILVSKSKEHATILLTESFNSADLGNTSYSNLSSGDFRQPKGFSWSNTFNTTNMTEFIKSLNDSINQAMANLKKLTGFRSLNLTNAEIYKGDPAGENGDLKLPIKTNSSLNDTVPKGLEFWISDNRSFENSTELSSSRAGESLNRTKFGRAVYSVATQQPFPEDQTNDKITESPNVRVVFFGVWPPEDRSSRNLFHETWLINPGNSSDLQGLEKTNSAENTSHSRTASNHSMVKNNTEQLNEENIRETRHELRVDSDFVPLSNATKNTSNVHNITEILESSNNSNTSADSTPRLVLQPSKNSTTGKLHELNVAANNSTTTRNVSDVNTNEGIAHFTIN